MPPPVTGPKQDSTKHSKQECVAHRESKRSQYTFSMVARKVRRSMTADPALLRSTINRHATKCPVCHGLPRRLFPCLQCPRWFCSGCAAPAKHSCESLQHTVSSNIPNSAPATHSTKSQGEAVSTNTQHQAELQPAATLRPQAPGSNKLKQRHTTTANDRRTTCRICKCRLASKHTCGRCSKIF